MHYNKRLMKKHLFLFITFLLFSISFGQVQNIADLSTGILEESKNVRDENQNLIGYLFLFNKGLINQDKSVQYEYVLLDNNLNKLTNGDFNLPNFKRLKFKISNLVYHQQKLYITSVFYHTTKFSRFGQNLKVIDMKNNEVIQDKFYRDNQFTQMSDIINFEELKPDITVQSSILIPRVSNSKIYYIDYRSVYYMNLSKLKNIIIYKQDFSKSFQYEIDTKMEKDGYDFNINEIKNGNIVIFQQKNNKTSGFPILGVDRLITYSLENGTIISNIIYNFPSKNGDEYYIPYTETVGDNLAVVGDIKLMNEQSVYNISSKPSYGLIRSVYDSVGKTITEKKIYYADIFKEYSFRDGRDSDGYKFHLKEYFNYNDNSYSVLLVKQKGDNIMTLPRTTDYILANFDKNGIYKNHLLLEKTKVKYMDSYLFSQENKEENEVLFFYAEELKENGKKEWFLTINKLKNGELSQVRMPFKTESSTIRFGIAKYGYIMITEYNKDDKERSVRIEKLNI